MRKVFLVIVLMMVFLPILICADKPSPRETVLTNHSKELMDLVLALKDRGVSEDWFWKQFNRDNFNFYEEMERYFTNMTEHRVQRGEMDISDYKRHFGVERKVELGRTFIENNLSTLVSLQEKNGIDYEVVVAILGMETNYASGRDRGTFYVFDSLVSQYLLLERRRRFSTNQLVALYEFSKQTGRDTDYFIGSFAGASGWGQFIPTSLQHFFVSADGDPQNIDIFSVEDTLFSIENYLFLHGLNGKTMDSEKHRRDAVFAYNRSDAYVQAVLYMYEKLKKLRTEGL